MPEQKQPDLWDQARGTAREDIRSIFTPELRTCPACGQTAETASRDCPHCGASYVVVQPKMSRRTKWLIAAGAAVLALVIAIGAVLAGPGIDRTKKQAAEREAVAKAQLVATLRAKALEDQRPRTAHIVTGSLVPALAAAVEADAKRRVAAGDLKGPIIGTVCDPYPATSARRSQEGDPAVPRNTYACTAATALIPDSAAHKGGRIGHPFLAVIDYRARRVTWCKVNPPPGEQAIGQGTLVPLSPRCTKP